MPDKPDIDQMKKDLKEDEKEFKKLGNAEDVGKKLLREFDKLRSQASKTKKDLSGESDQ
jgi:hypothetical protein